MTEVSINIRTYLESYLTLIIEFMRLVVNNEMRKICDYFLKIYTPDKKVCALLKISHSVLMEGFLKWKVECRLCIAH